MLRTLLTAAMTVAALAPGARAQASSHALRFFGTGQNQQDRVRIPIDDDQPGVDASSPCDVGAASFTIEFWLRGSIVDNATTSWGGDTEQANFDWIDGNTIVDRDIWGPSARDFGISIAGGFVRFGTGHADVNALDGDHTLEGNVNVLDGSWHHVACVRDSATGTKRIYVDGALDVASSPNASRDDISYPNDGVPGQQSPWGPYLVIGAEKHDAGAQYPSFSGRVDELRIWAVARTSNDILGSWDKLVPPTTAALVGSYRFEEGVGTTLGDSSAANAPAGVLVAGQQGNGEWNAWLQNTSNTAPVSNSALPPGFTMQTIATLLAEPTVLEFLPDGRLLVGLRNGTILVVQNGQLQSTPLCQIPVDTTFGERGLSGLAADPDFTNNGFLYVDATSPEPRNHVVRLTVIGNTADPQSAVVIWQNPQLAGTFHHGGDIHFAQDGTLLISTGDQTQSSNAQNLGSPHGKLLRVNKDGSIPIDNPFFGTPGVLPELWASGLRNPFRFTVDSSTGAVFVGNVGGNGSTAWEEIARGVSGANYGWPDREGPVCHTGTCAGISFPVFAYEHSDAAYAVGTTQGCVIAGPIYNGTAFPPAYSGNLFVADYANRWIRRLVFDTNGSVVASPVFVDAPAAGPVVDLEVGPDGALWVLDYGLQWTGAPDIGTLKRIAWTGTANVAPIAIAAADVTSGPVPLTVQFSSASSFDPDNGPSALAFAWDFGDGQTSTLANPTHTYTSARVTSATLTVSDGVGATAATPIAITIGNPPVPTILAPQDGTLYAAGDVITFSGAASDVEDGSLPPAALTWNVQLVHDEHAHPFFGPIVGASGQFTVPSSGHTPEHSHYRIRLDAVDSNGLGASASIDLEPRHATVVIDSVPQGVSFTIDGEPAATPYALESIEGFDHALAVPQGASIAGQPAAFVCWSDGGAREHVITTPAGGMNVTAFYGAAPQGTIAVSVPGVTRNANHFSGLGTSFSTQSDFFGLCFGRDVAGYYQTGLEFPLALAQGTNIISAYVDATATADQTGSVSAVIHAYDVASAPAFQAAFPAPALSTLHPLTAASVNWNPPAFTPGAVYASPDLTSLVQAIVNRGDWLPGNTIGFVIDGQSSTADAWRCIRNWQSGQPPSLHITYATATSVSCAQSCGFSSYGVGATPAHRLGLLGSGLPAVGGAVSVELSGVEGQSAILFAALQPASLPLAGGVLLVQPAAFAAVFGLPVIDGGLTLPFAIPSDPALAGISLYLQAAAADGSEAEGYAFSSGLKLTVCP